MGSRGPFSKSTMPGHSFFRLAFVPPRKDSRRGRWAHSVPCLSARSWGSTGWLNGSPGKFRGCGSPVFKVFKGFKHMLLGKAIALCIALKFLSTSAWILVWLVFGFRGGVYGCHVGSQRGQGIVSSAGISFRPGRIVGEVVGVIRFLVG